jgi:hypothetical protein
MLGCEWQLAIAIISYNVWCTVGGFEELDMGDIPPLSKGGQS